MLAPILQKDGTYHIPENGLENRASIVDIPHTYKTRSLGHVLIWPKMLPVASGPLYKKKLK